MSLKNHSADSLTLATNSNDTTEPGHRIFDHALVFNSAGHRGRAPLRIQVHVGQGHIVPHCGRKAPRQINMM
jgi:hypothetical protein